MTDDDNSSIQINENFAYNDLRNIDIIRECSIDYILPLNDEQTIFNLILQFPSLKILKIYLISNDTENFRIVDFYINFLIKAFKKELNEISFTLGDLEQDFIELNSNEGGVKQLLLKSLFDTKIEKFKFKEIYIVPRNIYLICSMLEIIQKNDAVQHIIWDSPYMFNSSSNTVINASLIQLMIHKQKFEYISEYECANLFIDFYNHISDCLFIQMQYFSYESHYGIITSKMINHFLTLAKQLQSFELFVEMKSYNSYHRKKETDNTKKLIETISLGTYTNFALGRLPVLDYWLDGVDELLKHSNANEISILFTNRVPMNYIRQYIVTVMGKLEKYYESSLFLEKYLTDCLYLPDVISKNICGFSSLSSSNTVIFAGGESSRNESSENEDYYEELEINIDCLERSIANFYIYKQFAKENDFKFFLYFLKIV